MCRRCSCSNHEIRVMGKVCLSEAHWGKRSRSLSRNHTCKGAGKADSRGRHQMCNRRRGRGSDTRVHHISAILTNVSTGRLSRLLSDVPIIDPMIITLKIMESMLELTYKVGNPPVSRVAMYRKPPKEEFIRLRKWLSENKSPEQRYNVRTLEQRRVPPRRRPRAAP